MDRKLKVFYDKCLNIELSRNPFLNDNTYYITIHGYTEIIKIDDFSKLLESIITHIRKSIKLNYVYKDIMFTSMTVLLNGVEIDYSQLTVLFNLAQETINLNN